MTARKEQTFQASLVRSLSLILTSETFFFAVPNGGWRSPREAAILVGQGVKPGIPDLVFICRGRPLGLELKTESGRLSDVQKIVHEQLRAAGMKVGVARNFDEVIAFLRAHDVPMRLKEAASSFARSGEVTVPEARSFGGQR